MEEIGVAKKALSGNLAENEESILKKLRDKLLAEEHEIHLNTCISIITETRGNYKHSLSLYANSNLGRYLVKLADKSLKECLIQMRGIAEAIQFLHRKLPEEDGECYCHMDLKPDNIVVFNEPHSPVGVWKVIDFGISKLRRPTLTYAWTRVKGSTNPPRKTFTIGTKAAQQGGTYQAPEVNEEIQEANKKGIERDVPGEVNGKTMGRRSDVWSLGCILAEVLAANLKTLDELRRKIGIRRCKDDGLYGDLSYFYERSESRMVRGMCRKGTGRFRLNKGFCDWLDDTRASAATHAGVIADYTQLMENMMVIKRTRRWKSDQVAERLGEILETF